MLWEITHQTKMNHTAGRMDKQETTNTQVGPAATRKLVIQARQSYKTAVVAVQNGLHQKPMYDDVGM